MDIDYPQNSNKNNERKNIASTISKVSPGSKWGRVESLVKSGMQVVQGGVQGLQQLDVVGF